MIPSTSPTGSVLEISEAVTERKASSHSHFAILCCAYYSDIFRYAPRFHFSCLVLSVVFHFAFSPRFTRSIWDHQCMIDLHISFPISLHSIATFTVLFDYAKFSSLSTLCVTGGPKYVRSAMKYYTVSTPKPQSECTALYILFRPVLAFAFSTFFWPTFKYIRFIIEIIYRWGGERI
jgi:hypothetical protein